MSESNIPTRIEELTCDWLTESLRSSGILETARVTDMKAEALGDGEGFMGEIFRLHLDFSPPESDAPSTLIAKLPTHVSENRAVGELVGAYEREIRFYREFAGRLPLRTPRIYFSDMEAGASSERDARGAAIIDGWPIWLIQKLMVFVTWLARRRTRRYVLLIEDFGSDGAGNQVAGCSVQLAREILESVAKLHAQYWREPTLADAPWLRRSDLNPRTMHALFLKHGPAFARNFLDRAPTGMEASLAWLDVNAVALLRAFHVASPETLLHCDLRLDNVILPVGDRVGEPIVFFDWQLAGRGPAAYDVAYFLSGALAADTSQDSELELVRAYHAALVANGVDDYPLDDCIRDYRRGLLSVLHRISSTDTMDVGSERGHDLFALWLERTLARLHGIDFDSLLD